MKTRKVIYADNGKILTNGEIYGRVIFVADNSDEKDFYEISEEEYRKIIEAQNKS